MNKGQMEKIEEVVSVETHYKVHCNIKKNIVNSLSSRDFPNLGFHIKYLCLFVVLIIPPPI